MTAHMQLFIIFCFLPHKRKSNFSFLHAECRYRRSGPQIPKISLSRASDVTFLVSPFSMLPKKMSFKTLARFPLHYTKMYFQDTGK